MHNKARILRIGQNASHLIWRIEANKGQQTEQFRIGSGLRESGIMFLSLYDFISEYQKTF